MATGNTDLTTKQKDMYLTILDFIETHGYPPTIRELQTAFNMSSPNGVVCHLEALSRKGWIMWENIKARSLKPLRDPIVVDRRTDVAKSARPQNAGLSEITPTIDEDILDD